MIHLVKGLIYKLVFCEISRDDIKVKAPTTSKTCRLLRDAVTYKENLNNN